MEESKGMNGGASRKVISMKGWREARMLEETLSTGLYFQSLVANEARDQEADPRHFEILYTINEEGWIESQSPFEYEEEEVFSTVLDEDRGNLLPLNRQVIERYEFYDLNTEDIHVIYRIPFHPLDKPFF